jgi:hypothetical protein
MSSVLQDWVQELPLRAQGTLLTGIRGCDVAPKLPTKDDRTTADAARASAARSGTSSRTFGGA